MAPAGVTCWLLACVGGALVLLVGVARKCLESCQVLVVLVVLVATSTFSQLEFDGLVDRTHNDRLSPSGALN